MQIKRRALLSVAAAGLLAGCRISFHDGLKNPCKSVLPDELKRHPAVLAAWQDIDPNQFWDAHVHLFGNGDSGSGCWVNPKLESWLSPMQFVQRLFYMNAGCVHDAPGRIDQSVVERLHNQIDGMRPGMKTMLFAFDYCHDESGEIVRDHSSFYVPNSYARDMARLHPKYFEWVASVHPYRKDAVQALEQASEQGARAVKWLPAAQGMDPASTRCREFYRAAARLRMPIIVHAGKELAVAGGDTQSFGNPLKLRYPLDRGVKIIVAHAASLGQDLDLDHKQEVWQDSFALFARLMDDVNYRQLLYADLSAVPQVNRTDVLPILLNRSEWHPRLLNGSDYPLPGIMPLFSIDYFVEQGWLDASTASVLKQIREHNVLLFDFVLKRHLRYQGQRFPNSVFQTRRFFESRT